MKIKFFIFAFWVLGLNANPTVPKNDVSFGSRIDGKLYLSTATMKQLREAGPYDPEKGEKSISHKDVVQSARKMLRTITVDADDWTCIEVTLERIPYTDYWSWVVHFCSPKGVFGIDGNDIAAIGVFVNGEAFSTSLDDEGNENSDQVP